MIIRPGYCTACLLAETDAAAFNGLLRAGRLPPGTLRRYDLSKHQAYRHRRHLDRLGWLVYYRPDEWQRRRGAAARLSRWRWPSGFCPNPAGRPRGAKDKRPRRRPDGIVAAIRADRRNGRRGEYPR